MLNNINFMITANELNTLLVQNVDVVVIDVRFIEEYKNGHIYAAVNFPEVFTYLPEGITTEKEKKDFINFYEDIFSKAGVDNTKTVVFYENKYTLKSPRGLVILKYLGYDENKIKVLDGGYEGWCRGLFKTNKKTIKNKKTKFTAKVDDAFFVDYNEMLEVINDIDTVILDVRDKDEWIGISSSPYGVDFAPKKGRLPNAVWIEWYYFITHDMMSVESLDKIEFELLKNNIKRKDKIILYCFKGARLSNTYIALRKLGYENIRIYFAGWNEWCRKEGAPTINEVENNDNLILQENIALKRKLDKVNIKNASLVDFPKHNTEPVFAFDRDGNIYFENESKKKHLPNIKKIADIFPDFTSTDIYNLIDNLEKKTTTIIEKGKYYSIKCIGSRDTNNILVYAFDTSEINILNKNLDNQYKLIHNIIDTVPVRIFWKNKDGVYFGANRLFLDDAKLNSEQDIIGKTDFEMPWGMTEAKRYMDDDISVMTTGTSRLNYEEIQTNKYGNKVILLTSKVPLKDAQENIIGILGIYEDITKKRDVENKLIQQSHLAQMGEMISMIAHQWRQPLSAISSTSIDLKLQSELASFDLEKKEEVKKYEAYVNDGLDNIDNLVQNLTTTIDDFRNFYKPNKEVVNVELVEIIKKSLNIIKQSIVNDNVKVIENYGCRCKIDLYENEMIQVILNILKNAQDNFKEKNIKDPYIKIETYEKDDKHMIKICDNGGGIPEDILPKIFDPYFSTKDEKNGTGLGLYMSKTIVEEHHNGKLIVKINNNGACFIIQLKV